MENVKRLAFLLLGAWLAGCGDAPGPGGGQGARSDAGDAVKISHFYAGQPVVTRGEAILLCYGVEAAKQVRLDPPVADLVPGYHRCFQVTPERDTTYRLTAVGAAGRTVTAEVAVSVRLPEPSTARPEPALITMFLASSPEIPAGFPVTLCYAAPEAASVSIQPPVQASLAPARRFCFVAKPAQTTTYILTARSASGYTETAEATVKVR